MSSSDGRVIIACSFETVLAFASESGQVNDL